MIAIAEQIDAKMSAAMMFKMNPTVTKTSSVIANPNKVHLTSRRVFPIPFLSFSIKSIIILS